VKDHDDFDCQVTLLYGGPNTQRLPGQQVCGDVDRRQTRAFESFFVFAWRCCTNSSPTEEMFLPNHLMFCSQVLDHLGLVGGLFDELGSGDNIDQATQQNPEMRDLTVGEAVRAMVLNGLGCFNHPLHPVPSGLSNSLFGNRQMYCIRTPIPHPCVEVSTLC
jgi:hypothetical protein